MDGHDPSVAHVDSGPVRRQTSHADSTKLTIDRANIGSATAPAQSEQWSGQTSGRSAVRQGHDHRDRDGDDDDGPLHPFGHRRACSLHNRRHRLSPDWRLLTATYFVGSPPSVHSDSARWRMLPLEGTLKQSAFEAWRALEDPTGGCPRSPRVCTLGPVRNTAISGGRVLFVHRSSHCGRLVQWGWWHCGRRVDRMSWRRPQGDGCDAPRTPDVQGSVRSCGSPRRC